MAKRVSLRPSDGESSSLKELIDRYHSCPPKVDTTTIHRLYSPIRNMARSVESALTTLSDEGSLSVGYRELSRFAVCDATYSWLSCKESSEIVSVKKELAGIVKWLPENKRIHCTGRIKSYALYSPLNPLPENNLTHLWDWNDDNKRDRGAIQAKLGFASNIFGVFLALSLSSLGEEVLGTVCNELRSEYEFGMMDIRQYLTNLKFVRDELTINAIS